MAGNEQAAVSIYEKALSFPYNALYTAARLEIAEYLALTRHDQAALDELNNILDHEEDNDKARLLKAQIFLRMGNIPEAEENVDAVLKKDPTNLQARLTKADILVELGQEREAVLYYQEVLSRNLTPKQEFEARYGLITAYLSLHQYSLAESNFHFLKTEFPNQLKRKEMLGQKLAEAQGLPPQPLSPPSPPPKVAEKQPVKKAPPPPQVKEEKVSCTDYLDKIQTAKQEKNIGQLAVLYKDLGDCYVNMQDKEKAVEAYEAAFSYPPVNLSIKQRIEMAAFLGNMDRYDPAITELTKILAKEPKNVHALILIARFYSWRGKENDQKQAEHYIDQALALKPENTEARIIKANVLTYTKRSEQAIMLYQELLEKKSKLSPEESFWVRYGLALAYTNEHEYALAEMQLTLIEIEFAYQEKKITALRRRIKEGKAQRPKELLAEKKKQLNERVQYANALLNQRCFNIAMFELYQVLRDDPSNLYARLIQARGLGLIGDYYEAIKELDAIIQVNPTDIDAWIFKGTMLRWSADIPGSTCAFLQALCLDADNFDARIGLAWTDLARGDQMSAYQLAAATSISEPYQVQAMRDLCWGIALGPNVGFDFARYRDSDKIKTEDYYVNVNGYVKDYKFNLLYHHVWANQPVYLEQNIYITERVDAAYLNGVKYCNPCLDVGGGIGYAHSTENEYLLASALANYHTDCGNFTFSTIYDVYTATAAAIFFEIRTWQNLISYVNVLSGWCTVGGDYIYTYFSDSNHSNRVDLWLEYKLIRQLCWEVALDYRFRFWDFADQPISPFVVPGIFGGHGYFDPFNYYGNHLGLSFILATKRMNILIHPYTAYLTYDQTGRHNGFIYAGNLNLQYNFNRKVATSFGFEAGRYPLKNLRYSYTSITAGLDWNF